MEQVNDRYKKVLEILRRNNPEFGPTYEIEENVLERISRSKKSKAGLSDLLDFLFGWTYITWVRRSLITASVCLVSMFVLQQSLMIRQINHLSRQIESYESDASGFPGGYQEKQMMMLRIQGKRIPFLKTGNPDKQVNELFRTIDELKREYKELDKIIEANPELKKMIEKKLSEISGNKIIL